MPRVNAQDVLSGLVGALLGLLPLAPPEHVHEVRTTGHVTVILHRHVEPHGIVRHSPAPGSTAFDDDDPILTLTPVYTVPAPVVATPSSSQPRAVIESPSPRFVWQAMDVEHLIHGPPRTPPALRGPPFSLAF
jgi:hypothetical protein